MGEAKSRVRIRCPNCDRVVATLPDLEGADHAYTCPYCRSLVKPPFSLRRFLKRLFGASR